MGLSEEGQHNAHPGCCPHLHAAVELIGRRWTGAIIEVLRQGGSMRFSEVLHAVPALSDRLLSERLKDLEAHGVVERTVDPGPPVRVEYALTDMGHALEPALDHLGDWARTWLSRHPVQPSPTGGPPANR
jgi:DNA-binding HxlR family transcriptional regulator